jgi:hypothetical protein
MPKCLFQLAALLTVVTVGAQAPDSAARPTSPPARKTLVTVNPFAIFATYFAGDVETILSPSTTLGAGASYVGFGDYDRYGALEAKVRYYPQEKALYGFSVAGTLGLASYRQDVTSYTTYDGTGTIILSSSTSGPRRTRATLGTELSYQWLLGPKRRFVSVIGLGVKRLLGNESYSSPFESNVIPTARINIGFAF